MAKTENVELTVLCLIQDGDKILLHILFQAVMLNRENLLSMP